MDSPRGPQDPQRKTPPPPPARRERGDPTDLGGAPPPFRDEKTALHTADRMETAGVVESTEAVHEPTLEPSVVVEEPGSASWDEVSFYYREALAVAAQQPERTGLMWCEAARAAQAAGSPRKTVLQYLQSALAQAPQSPALISLVRREMVRLGQHDAALELTARLVQVGGDVAERAGCLLEAATLQRHVKGNSQAALRLLEQELALQPANITALTLSALYHLELGEYAAAAARFEELADVLGAPIDRSACLHAAATLHELRLDQLERADQDYRRALELDPGNLPAWLAASSLHLQTGDWHDLCYELEQLAARLEGKDLQLGALLGAGALHLHRTEDLASAAAVLTRAAQVAPAETAPLSRLAHIFESTGELEQLVAVLRRLLQLTVDPPGRAELLLRIGHLLELRLGLADEATVAYRQALEARPGHRPALQALGAMLRSQNDHDGLLEILLPETEGSDDPARRAMRCTEVGEILTDELRRPLDAIVYYQRAIELDPQLRLAAWRLAALLREHGRFAELAKLLTWQLETTTDEGSRYHLLRELAGVQAGPLDESLHAIDSLKRALAIGQNRTAAMELIELYQRTDSHRELVELLLWEAERTRDLPEATWRRIQAAMVLERRLEEHDRALAVLWQVLEQVPTSVGAIRVAGRIYYARGRWQDLTNLYLHELNHERQLAESPEAWCRIGRIYEENLGLHDKAIEAYRKALSQDSGSTVALYALERLVGLEHRHRDLVTVLEWFAKLRREPHACCDLLCRAGELADARLGEMPRAAQLYAEAVQRHPDSTAALHALADIQQRLGQFGQACATLQQLIARMRDRESQALLLVQQARLREFRLDETDPRPYDLAGQLPLFAPRVRLDQIRTRLGAGDKPVIAILLAAGSATVDDLLGAGLLAEAALRSEWRSEVESQREAATRALSRNAEELATTWCLERALAQRGDLGGLATLLEGEAARHSDSVVRVSLLGLAAQACLGAERLEEAGRLSRQCLSINKQHVSSIQRLIQLAAGARNYTQLASLYDQLAATCADRGNRLQASLLAADCWSERVGDPANALGSLKRTLAEDPQQPDAFNRAWRLLTSLGDFGQLSQLYVRRIAACNDVAERAELLRQHITLLRQKLDDTPSAIAALGELLELCPEDVEALQALADLSQAAQRWSDAADALAHLAHCCPDRAQSQRARLDQARIALKRLQEPQKARALLERLLEEDGAILEAKRLLVEVHVEGGRWEEAQRLLDEITSEGPAELQVWARIQQAEVARVGLRNEATQEQHEREAVVLAAEHPGLLEKIVVHFREHRRQRRLVEVASRVDKATSPAGAARLRLVTARLLLEDLNEPERAVEYLRASLQLDPRNVEANLLMGEALEHRGDIENAVKSYRKVLVDAPRRVEAYRGLNRLMGLLGKPALATTAAALLDLLGAATPAEKGQVRTLDQLDFPPGTLSVAALPLRPALAPVREVLELVAPHLGLVYPFELTQPLDDDAPIALAARQIAVALGLEGLKVSTEGERPSQACAGTPPLLRLSPQLGRQPRGPAFRFWVGQALAGASSAGALLQALTNQELDELLEALFSQRPGPATQQLRKRVFRVLPRKVRRQLEQQPLQPVDARLWDVYRAEELRRADAVGLLMCGNPRVACTQLAASDGRADSPTESRRARELIGFALSDQYAALHVALWSTRRLDRPV